MSTPKKSLARSTQQKHWERTGQISTMIGLTQYILSKHNEPIPVNVKTSLNIALTALRAALQKESRNNEFIHLNIQAPWMKNRSKK